MDTQNSEFRKEGKFIFKDSVEYSENSIVSKHVVRDKSGNISLFAFDAKQELSEHTASFDALVQVLEGKVRIQIQADGHILTEGESIIMPANIPHAVYAEEKFKMLLTMIKSE